MIANIICDMQISNNVRVNSYKNTQIMHYVGVYIMFILYMDFAINSFNISSLQVIK